MKRIVLVAAIVAANVAVAGEKTATGFDASDGIYRITMSQRSLVQSDTKVKTATTRAEGILVKGTTVSGIADGTIVLWSKTKANRDEHGYYMGRGYDASTVVGQVFANKSAGIITIPVDETMYIKGTGFGATIKDKDKTSPTYGEYAYVKNLSGKVVTLPTDESNASLVGDGTWKISYDSSSTKLADKGYDLDAILLKKGVVEVYDED